MNKLYAVAVIIAAVVGTSLGILPSHNIVPSLETFKQWNLLTYNFEWGAPANDKNFFNPEQIVATGIDVFYDRIFIATPRLFSGVPATLSTISNTHSGDSPVLEAYPDWSYHTIATNQYNCSEIGLVSVYRLRIDSCNRLWALDAGVSRSLEDYEITCSPKILVFDLNTDQVVRRIDFPPEVVQSDSLFTNLIIDETEVHPENNCDDVFVYITDTVAAGIVVYDSKRDLTWRLSHPSMFADPNFAESTIDDYKFTLMDGIVGFAFDPQSKLVYYQPLATDRLFSVSTAALKAGPLQIGTDLPVNLVGRKSSQGIGLAVSPYGSIFFSPFTETAIAEWNPKANSQKVLAYDPEKIQFAADIRTTPFDTSNLYILTSRFHRYFLKNLNINEANTRILRIKIRSPSYSPFSDFNVQQPRRPSIYNQQSLKLNSYTAQPTPPSPIVAYNTIATIKPFPQYVENYVSPVKKQPYRFESVGVINRNVNNPFIRLNTGESPQQYFPKQFPTSYNEYNLNSRFPNFQQQDYNGLRFAKSVSYNVSTYHN